MRHWLTRMGMSYILPKFWHFLAAKPCLSWILLNTMHIYTGWSHPQWSDGNGQPLVDVGRVDWPWSQRYRFHQRRLVHQHETFPVDTPDESATDAAHPELRGRIEGIGCRHERLQKWVSWVLSSQNSQSHFSHNNCLLNNCVGEFLFLMVVTKNEWACHTYY